MINPIIFLDTSFNLFALLNIFMVLALIFLKESYFNSIKLNNKNAPFEKSYISAAIASITTN